MFLKFANQFINAIKIIRLKITCDNLYLLISTSFIYLIYLTFAWSIENLNLDRNMLRSIPKSIIHFS